MATEVLKQLSIVYNNARTYLAAHTLGLNESALGYDMIMRLYMDGSKSGYATLNDAAKAELFPSETARPHQLDVKFASYAQFDRADNSVAFSVSGEELHRASGLGTSETHVDESFTGATIDGMTKTTEMRFTLHSNSTVCAVCVISADLTLHFWQYACAANAAGNGIANAAVSNVAPYQGESITFTAQLKPGATWHGWYVDATCTQLVSTDQTYTTAAADLTLYAKATREVTGTGAYAKLNGQYAEAQRAFKKISGAWVLQSDIAAVKQEMQNGNYKLRS